MAENAENKRLRESREGEKQWKKWGPYLAERQWGTVGRITAQTATPGIISATIRHAPAPTTGARTAWRASVTTIRCCA